MMVINYNVQVSLTVYFFLKKNIENAEIEAIFNY
ncbi:Uncharacterised protein [Roseburia hominis]|nr:Uncharacterised protein [Roseburia hominis]